MKKIIYIQLLFLAVFYSRSSQLYAQTLKGTVREQTPKGLQPLPGVHVYWLHTYTGATTDASGLFEITPPSSYPADLVFSFVGYQTDTLRLNVPGTIQHILKSSVTLGEVAIERRRESTTVSTINPINTQVITSGELKKAACCNLAESFETNPSVDVSYADAVSGARQIQMLGLDGIYTQILSENLPLVRGLSSSYGLNFIPGPFVESIYVSKGVGSVVNGYESITGQINIEVTEPDQADRLFVNGYVNSDLRPELNLHLAHHTGKHASALLFLHGSQAGLKKDMNQDSFLDSPQGQQYNIYNRWHFTGKNMEGQLGLRAVIENRYGGQLNADKNIMNPSAPAEPYRINIRNRQFELYTKTGYMFPARPDRSLGLMTSTKYNLQDMTFGMKAYRGRQTGFYSNLIFQDFIGSDKNIIKAGLSLVYDNYLETYNDSVMDHHETVPGGFAEYRFNDKKKISFITGARMDYHNTFGWFFTPRVHFKYDLRPGSVLRLSGGSGFRSAQVLTENPSVFANSRIIVFREELRPEKAWNTGASFTHKFDFAGQEGTLVVDYYYTRFVNQVVVDLENITEVRFYNLDGISYSHGYQAQLDYSPFKRFDIRLAYKRYEVKSHYSGQLLDKPFVPRDRALLNLAYATSMDKWKFDVTLKWFGLSRIPDTGANPESYRSPDHSTEYITLMAQLTKAFRKFDLYAGAENITNFIQKNAVIAPDDPYGSYFDASLIWGPVTGRMFYAGFRFNIR